jgi:cytoskeletal protein CcmA (bactofilin family)
MFNLKGNDRFADAKDAGKAALKPALYDPPGALAKPGAANAPRPSTSPAVSVREGVQAPGFTTNDENAHAATTTPGVAATKPRPSEPSGSKLFVGINIKLKGVEISDCDVLIIEGHVEATVHSHGMEIAKPGTLQGTALIDIAEVYGQFSGELTARTRLVVHGTGRVAGVIRYGQLVVEEGGEISGDVKRLDAPDLQANSPRLPTPDAPYLPQPARGIISG